MALCCFAAKKPNTKELPQVRTNDKVKLNLGKDLQFELNDSKWVNTKGSAPKVLGYQNESASENRMA